MKRMSLLLMLAICAGAWAQESAQTAAPASMARKTYNQRRQNPTYADIYCAGFVSKENIPTTNRILGGYNAPHTTKFATRDVVYLNGSGYAVGNRYTILRKVQDPNRYEMFPGQHKLLSDSGFEYAEIGQLTISRLEKDVAVAEVTYSCQTLSIGDFLVPFQEKPMVKFRTVNEPFQEFAPYSGTAARIIDGKEFDQVLGTGSKVYINMGANKGLKPGDYLRVTRNYNPNEMDPVDRLSMQAPSGEDTMKDPPKVKKGSYKGIPYLGGNEDDERKFPYRGVGELVVISVTPETATAMVTFALEDLQVGDVVEIPARKTQQQGQQ